MKTSAIRFALDEKPAEDPYYPAAVKNAKEAVRRLEAGIIAPRA